MGRNILTRFFKYLGNFFYKLRPRFSVHYIAYTILFGVITFTVSVNLSAALYSTTPTNPGHPWIDIGYGAIQFANTQNAVRTYTLPDADAALLSTNAAVTVPQGGTGLSSIADKTLLVTTGANTLSALVVPAGQSIRRNAGDTAFEAFTPGTESTLTFSSGLTRATNTITNNLITGVAGGQTVIGGTGTTDVLSLQGTTGNGNVSTAAIQMLVGNNGATNALTIYNSGSVTANAGLVVTKNLSPVNLSTAARVIGYAYNWDPAGGSAISQWGGGIYEMHTVAGQTNLGDVNGLLTAFYHDKGFTVPYWAGVETGAMFLDGASSIVTQGYGLRAVYPTLTNGASVGTFAPVYVSYTSNTGLPNWYSILSESPYPAQFVGNAGIKLTTSTGAYASLTTSTNTLVVTGGTTGVVLRDSAIVGNDILTAVAGTTRLSGLGYRGDTNGRTNGALIFNTSVYQSANMRRWTIANNQNAIGSLGFFVSSSSSVDPDITTPGTAAFSLASNGDASFTSTTASTSSSTGSMTLAGGLGVAGAGYFGTSVNAPLHVGGTGVTDVLSLKGTTGNGTLTSPAIQALVGNNGATTALTILNNGNVGIGTTGPGSLFDIQSGGSSKFAVDSTGITTTTGTFLGAVGTESLPTYSFNGTTNLGWYARGTNLTASVAGTARFDVGVSGATLRNNAQLAWSNSAIGSTPYVGLSNGGGSKLYVGTGNVGSSDGTLIAGNIGVGTTSPSASLHIAQSTTGIGTVTTNATTTLVGSTTPGSSTQFTNTFKVGDTITVSGETVRTIQTITDDTHLTVTVAFSTSASGLSYTLTGGDRFIVKGNGNIGIGTTTPTYLLTVGTPSSSNTAITPTLKLQGYNISDGVTGSYGSYGGMVFHTNGAYSGAARRYLITNALGTSKFAIIRSVDASTDPSLGTGGAITSGTADFVMDNTGNVGLGVLAPTAVLHLKAGTATANTAPLKFTSGTLLGTTEAGAVEYDGTHLYFSATNGGTRYQIDQQTQIVATTAPAANMFSISNAGQGVTTAGVSGMQITYVGGAAAVEAQAARIDLTGGTTAAGVWSGLRLVQGTITPGTTVQDIKLETAALTQTTAVTTNINGLSLPTVGALSTTTTGASNIINYAGLNVTTPAATVNFAGSTILNDGIKIAQGAYTVTTTNSAAGGMNGLDIAGGTISVAAAQNGTISDINLTTAALTSSTTGISRINGLVLGSAGALVQNTAAGTINWRGLAIQMPAITQTTGTINSTGLEITTAAVTTGGNARAINVIDNNGNSIFDVKDPTTGDNNFGAIVTSGAFINNTSFLGEEFNADTHFTATTATAGVNVGDSSRFVYRSNSTLNSYSTPRAVNGVARFSYGATTVVGSMIAYGIPLTTTIDNIFKTSNLPVMQVKFTPVQSGGALTTTTDYFIGLMDTITPPTTDNTLPANGVLLWSNDSIPATGGTLTYQGIVRSGSATVGTPVSCTGTYTYGNAITARIQVETATTARFLMDFNASDGINFTDCGIVTGTFPTAQLAPEFYGIHNEAVARQFDLDYMRIWQDDSAIPNENQALVIENKPELFDSKKVLADLIASIDPGVAQGQDANRFDTERLIAGTEIVTPKITTDTLLVNKISTAVAFEMPPIFNKDTAGFALVKNGDRRVAVTFENPYIAEPVVNTSVSFETNDNVTDSEAETFFNAGVQYIITNKSQAGFTILLNKNAPRNIRFSWTAFGVKDAKVYESVVEGLVITPPPANPPADPVVSPTNPPADPVNPPANPPTPPAPPDVTPNPPLPPAPPLPPVPPAPTSDPAPAAPAAQS